MYYSIKGIAICIGIVASVCLFNNILKHHSYRA